MQRNHFLLMLHLTKGIGSAAEAKIIAAITHDQAPKRYPWSVYALCQILQINPNSKQAQNITYAYQQQLNQNIFPIDVDYITYFDEAYPIQLREIFEPPLILFYQGHLAALKLPNLAIVGTRTATNYGYQALQHLLPDVVHSGTAVISGLAKGIDTMAHQITLRRGGVPIAVIGTGIDQFYPASNRQLQSQIARSGLVLSEYAPGCGPYRSHFPARNRIIAGLSSATLVVEAKIKSGSLITANSALQNNREVLTIPGPIFAENSQGTNELLALGAKPVVKSKDILESIQIFDSI